MAEESDFKIRHCATLNSGERQPPRYETAPKSTIDHARGDSASCDIIANSRISFEGAAERSTQLYSRRI